MRELDDNVLDLTGLNLIDLVGVNAISVDTVDTVKMIGNKDFKDFSFLGRLDKLYWLEIDACNVYKVVEYLKDLKGLKAR